MGSLTEALRVIFTETYYLIMIIFIFLIHVGFCLYEVGVSRRKNHLFTLIRHIMVIPLVTVTFYLFGWWLYFALQNGPGITGGLKSAPGILPWSELMGMHMGGEPMSETLTAADTMGLARLNGVFFGAFTVFAWTAACIISGSCIERIRSSAFWILAVLIGSVVWVVEASWGWSAHGWMVQILGYHDTYASGVIHAVCGGFTLGILLHLGPRIGKFASDGTPRDIVPRNKFLIAIGLLLIFTGFWGFYLACNTPIFDFGSLTEAGKTFFSSVTIYKTPVTNSGVTLNFLLSMAGGFLSTYMVSKGENFWTFSGGLAGVIAASAGNDLYHPIQAFLIALIVPPIAYKLHNWVEKRFKLDDAVGAVAVHGYTGFLGVIIAGFVLWGYPASPFYDVQITPWGNLMGAIIMFLGFGVIPGYISAGILKKIGILRMPKEIELAGLDFETMEIREEAKQNILEAEQGYALKEGLTSDDINK